MLIEYPSYMEAFRCVGGDCPDTCCAGWIVDVDEESFYYYQTVPGAFGERLRQHLREEDGAKFFPMTKEKRCPFLNRKNLCDIFTELGEDRLCQVCTEYPRWYTRAGYYEQQDLSLSCMEVSRLFFTAPEICYCRAMSADPGEELTPEEEEGLVFLLAVRNEGLEILSEANREDSLAEKLQKLGRLIRESQQISPAILRALSHLNERLQAAEAEAGAEERDEDAFQTAARKEYEALPEWPVDTVFLSAEAEIAQMPQKIARLAKLDPLNPAWESMMQRLKKLCETQTERGRTVEALRQFREHPEYPVWFSRLGSYFWFRYLLDGVLQNDMERGYRMLVRSLETIEFMCVSRIREKNEGVWPKTLSDVFNLEEMMDVAHIFSKEVEHDAENLEILQWR